MRALIVEAMAKGIATTSDEHPQVIESGLCLLIDICLEWVSLLQVCSASIVRCSCFYLKGRLNNLLIQCLCNVLLLRIGGGICANPTLAGHSSDGRCR